MGYYPIKLDKVRNLRYGMRAIDRIEKKLKKKIGDIDGATIGNLSMEEYATFIWAGLVHEDKDLTPNKVMDLIDEHSSLGTISKEMWTAFNAMYAGEDEKEGKEEKVEEKNE